MKRAESGEKKRSWLFLGAFILCAALVKPVQDRVEARAGDRGVDPDLLYFSSPSVVKRMALSYDRLLADIYWMRTIQYYGRRDEADKRKVRYKNLASLLDITTTLDPDLLDAYRVGSVFLGEEDPVGAGQPEEAVKLLEKGIRAHPKDWHLRYDKGFAYYWYLKDYRKAGETWREGSRIAGAPHWMQPLSAMAFSKGGDFDLAVALWQNQYQGSSRQDVKENARNHLISIQVAKDLWTMEFLAGKHRQETGAFPVSLAELKKRKPGKYEIADPLGMPYRYNAATGAVSLSLESKVRYLQVPLSFKEQLFSTLEQESGI